jgi:response regulator RpfG family c-di-GMP phosphodiesterase
LLLLTYQNNFGTLLGISVGKPPVQMKGSEPKALTTLNGDHQRMDKQKLRRQLEQLHAELQQVGSLDSVEREMLQKLAANIGKILERKEYQTQHYSGLSERLREAVAQLEASHPKATILMRQVLDQLAYMGI